MVISSRLWLFDCARLPLAQLFRVVVLATALSIAPSISPARAAEEFFGELGNILKSGGEFFDLTVAESQRRERMNRLQKDLSQLAGRQDDIIAELSKWKIVIREELRRAFRENEAGRFRALVKEFGRRSSLNDMSNDWLMQSSREVDRVAFRIGSYEFAAFPWFLGATSLELALHNLSMSPPVMLQELISQRKITLARWLDAADPQSIEASISALENELGPHQAALRLLGKSFPVAEYIETNRFALKYSAHFSAIQPDRTSVVVLIRDHVETVVNGKRLDRYDFWSAENVYRKLGKIGDSNCTSDPVAPGRGGSEYASNVGGFKGLVSYVESRIDCIKKYFDRSISEHDSLSTRLEKLKQIRAVVISMQDQLAAVDKRLQHLVDAGQGNVPIALCKPGIADGVSMPICSMGAAMKPEK
jgi:hypothetical protein